MEIQRIYKNNSNPLEEVYIEDAKVGEKYVTSTGTRIKFTDQGVYEIDKTSPLREGEVVETLTEPKGVELLWKLLNR